MSLAVLIMAGGTGARLWPISRPGRAKQFAPIVGETSLLEQTYRRVKDCLPEATVFVNVTAGNEGWVHRLLPDLPVSQVIAAPSDRDTLPTLGYATLTIERAVPAPTMLMLASDNLIGTGSPLRQAFLDAIESAARGPYLVSIGVTPSYASTQYGYMHLGERAPFGSACYFGLGYREKPDARTAQQLIARGDHDWNSGMFAWTANTFWDAMRAFAPASAAILDHIDQHLDQLSNEERRDAFNSLPRIAVDQGILEHVNASTKQKHIFVRANLAWDDVGSYAALARYLAPDQSGNRLRGPIDATLSRDCTLISDAQRRLRVRGIRDLIVASDSGDVLVAKKESFARVRELADCELWPGVHCNEGITVPAARNSVCGFVKSINSRNCVVESDSDGIVALLDIEDVSVRISDGQVFVSSRSLDCHDAEAIGEELAPRAPPDDLPPSLQVKVLEDDELMSARAAAHVVASLEGLLRRNRSPLVMFSAGRTPLKLFALLRSQYRTAVDWPRVRLAQMDEYAHVNRGNSYAAFLRREVFDPLGMAEFLEIDAGWDATALQAYELSLLADGLDLVVHGIGCNGHLGFNEPGSALDGQGGILDLADSTRAGAASAFGSPEAVPHRGLTLGLGSLSSAREVILMASGVAKSAAVHAALFGPIDRNVPASSLRTHSDVSVYLDRFAASHWLRRRQ